MDYPVKTRTTFAEYAALPESNQIVELIDGEIVVNPPLFRHQKALVKIILSLQFLSENGEICVAPTGLKFDDGNSFEPDLFWVSESNTDCVLGADGRYWYGAPDLVVEILSPSTEVNDRGHKFQTYQRYGIREYWMVNPEAKFVEVYTLSGSRLTQQGIYEAAQPFASAVLGGVTIDPKTWFSD
ncbi:MAG: Uma2 family endonuclease [Chloroflexi bacterium]|nr:Uma2 family endonuclease [Chloroflexota bacterium]MCC6892928.1 Uma2 family endonuclease [Anaerolineae bacterium]